MNEAEKLFEDVKQKISQLVEDNQKLRQDNHNLRQNNLTLTRKIDGYRINFGGLSDEKIEEIIKKYINEQTNKIINKGYARIATGTIGRRKK